ncbi:MAG TPA: prolipoprotein diacylglyceryl transferase [Candidatus Micrarchaeaceae archaeon]|nr:prolipoprotein diacylglyceryl transferase [Candidatus Micrarchaeaceae archaeon]
MIPLSIVIDLDPNLFRLGPFLITWHGVFAVVGILAAARLGLWLLAKDRVDVTHGADGVAWMVVFGLIGARLLYVWENYKLFEGQLGRIFLLTEGGISQWGGLFGAMLGAYIWARRAAINYWKLIDAAGAATMIGLAIGRIGDVINGEHHGTPTNLPWGVEYVNPNTLGQPGIVVHPEVAYEMILTLGLLGLILPFHQRLKQRLPDGALGLVYLGLYGLGRFFLSYMRTDPVVFAGLRQAQLGSLLMLVIAVVAIPILVRRRTMAVPGELVSAPSAAPMELVAASPHGKPSHEPEPAPSPERVPAPEIPPEPEPAPSDEVPAPAASPRPRAPRKPPAPGAPRVARTKKPPESPEPPDELPG